MSTPTNIPETPMGGTEQDSYPKSKEKFQQQLQYIFQTMIQFPPEMDENWVRYGLAKLGQISKLPNWQKIVVLCVHNTTSALNS